MYRRKLGVGLLVGYIFQLTTSHLAASQLTSVSYGSDAYVREFTGGMVTGISIAGIIAMTLVTQARFLRVLRIIFTWISAVFATQYVAMIQETPKFVWGMGAYVRASPLANGPTAPALVVTGVLCIAFAIYATIRVRKDHDALSRVLLGPLPFAGVVGVLFYAKSLMFTDLVIRNRHGWENIAGLIWLAAALLVVCAIIAKLSAAEPPPNLPAYAGDGDTMGQTPVPTKGNRLWNVDEGEVCQLMAAFHGKSPEELCSMWNCQNPNEWRPEAREAARRMLEKKTEPIT